MEEAIGKAVEAFDERHAQRAQAAEEQRAAVHFGATPKNIVGAAVRGPAKHDSETRVAGGY